MLALSAPRISYAYREAVSSEYLLMPLENALFYIIIIY